MFWCACIELVKMDVWRKMMTAVKEVDWLLTGGTHLGGQNISFLVWPMWQRYTDEKVVKYYVTNESR